MPSRDQEAAARAARLARLGQAPPTAAEVQQSGKRQVISITEKNAKAQAAAEAHTGRAAAAAAAAAPGAEEGLRQRPKKGENDKYDGTQDDNDRLLFPEDEDDKGA